jgi:hypothetical protein
VGDSTLAAEARQLTQVLQRVNEIIPNVLELDHCNITFSLFSDKPVPPAIRQSVVATATANLRTVVSALAGLRYPFPHARPDISVLEYVQLGIPAAPPAARVEVECAAYAGQLLALNRRALGRLAMIAEKIEAQVIAA